jgi:hypothetical protein
MPTFEQTFDEPLKMSDGSFALDRNRFPTVAEARAAFIACGIFEDVLTDAEEPAAAVLFQTAFVRWGFPPAELAAALEDASPCWIMQEENGPRAKPVWIVTRNATPSGAV